MVADKSTSMPLAITVKRQCPCPATACPWQACVREGIGMTEGILVVAGVQKSCVPQGGNAGQPWKFQCVPTFCQAEGRNAIQIETGKMPWPCGATGLLEGRGSDSGRVCVCVWGQTATVNYPTQPAEYTQGPHLIQSTTSLWNERPCSQSSEAAGRTFVSSPFSLSLQVLLKRVHKHTASSIFDMDFLMLSE